jgi:hypothetical protein
VVWFHGFVHAVRSTGGRAKLVASAASIIKEPHMHIFLVVVSVWSMAYRGEQSTPTLVKEMPSFASCWEAGKAIQTMAPRAEFRCTKTP